MKLLGYDQVQSASDSGESVGSESISIFNSLFNLNP